MKRLTREALEGALSRAVMKEPGVYGPCWCCGKRMKLNYSGKLPRHSRYSSEARSRVPCAGSRTQPVAREEEDNYAPEVIAAAEHLQLKGVLGPGEFDITNVGAHPIVLLLEDGTEKKIQPGQRFFVRTDEEARIQSASKMREKLEPRGKR